MEDIKIIEWLKNNSSNGYGDGGDAHGGGWCDGNGDGGGDSSGSGHGDACGNGFGCASGGAYCWESGDGCGDGSGEAPGWGNIGGDGCAFSNYSGLKSFNGDAVFYIDYIPTIIKRITCKKNIACGFILNGDFTLTKCFVAKCGNYFAHGETLKEAVLTARQKRWGNMDIESAIEEFCKEFKPNKKYKCSKFFKWHNYLTGSCKMGRETFMKNHDIKMNNEFTVDEFIELTINDYGGEIIEQLKGRWDKLKKGESD